MARLPELPEPTEFLNDTLELPVHGHTYVVASVDGETGLQCARLMKAGAAVARGGDPGEAIVDDDAEADLIPRLLGPALHEMVADGVDWPVIKHAALTVMVWTVTDVETATRYWTSGGDPEAFASPKSGAAATMTRRAASTTSTSRAKKPTAKKPAGKTSSRAGH